MTRRLALITLVMAVLLSACSDDGDEPAASTTTSEATTTTTEAPTTTAAPVCPAVSVPNAAEELTELEGDADGDDADDALRTFRVGEEWHLQVELAAGGGADLVIPSFGGAVGLIGGADVDGDGADEIWARTGSGASATIVGLARFVDCGLVRVTFASGELAELPIGGSVGTASGLECATDPGHTTDLTAFTATFTEGSSYDVAAIGYALEGTALVEQGATNSTVDANDDDFLRYTSFTCEDLTL